ncbi:MAG: acyl-[acyl-carrier-protein] thioesterase [Bacteroidales bacterium]
MQENKLSLHTSFTVTSAETDMYGRIRLSALLNFLIQSAIQSADSLGFGFSQLKKQQLFWVLSRMNLEIVRPLAWYETVKVETWPKNVEKILYIRDFLVRDRHEKIVARATSGWLAIDKETKRPGLYRGYEAESLTRLKNKQAMKEFPQKTPPVEYGETFHIQPAYFDMDLNRHVTSTRYIDWMMDTFPVDFHAEHYPTLLNINYLKETRPGMEMLMRRRHYEKEAYGFQSNHLPGMSPSVRGQLVFAKNRYSPDGQFTHK